MFAPSTTAPSQRYLAPMAAALVAMVSGTWLWSHHLAQQELLALPAAERQSLYVHTLETLETVCKRAIGSDLSDYCRDQAQFLTRLPECEAACQNVCRSFSSRPTK